MLKQINKVINDSKKTIEASKNNNIENDYIYLNSFLNSGCKLFLEKDKENEEENEVFIYQSIFLIQRLECARSILEFEKNSNENNFNEFLNTIHLELSRYILVSNDLKGSRTTFFESDISLLYFFVVMYYPDIRKKIEPFFERGLEQLIHYNLDKELNLRNCSGRNSLCYLAFLISGKLEKDSKISKLFLLSCGKIIDPIYENISGLDDADNQQKISVVNDLIDFHLTNTKLDHFSVPFYRKYWIYFPIEIFLVIKFFDIETIGDKNELVDKFLPLYKNNFIAGERNIKILNLAFIQ